MDAVNHIQLRNMEAVEPQTFDALDAAVVCAPTEAMEKEIRTKLDEFSKEYLEARATRGELAVVFLQKRPRKGWFATTEELIPWELHLITLDFTPSAPTTDRYASSSSSSRQQPPSLVPALTQILMFCADKRHAVPPLGGPDSGLSHQIMVNPPPPSELFSPSPPLPARSPPPVTSTTIATAHLQARDTAHASPSSAAAGLREARGYDRDRDRERERERDRHQHDRFDRADRADRAERTERRGSAPLSPTYAGANVDTDKSATMYTGRRGERYEYKAGYGTERDQREYTAGQGQGQGGTGAHDGAAQGGYLDAAKDGLRAVRAGAGVVANWAGRGR